jgi:uncharacterized Zn finger protein
MRTIIAKAKGSTKRLDDRNYVVYSQSGNASYNVYLTNLSFACSCPDQMYRDTKCKHIHAVEFSFIGASPRIEKGDQMYVC